MHTWLIIYTASTQFKERELSNVLKYVWPTSKLTKYFFKKSLAAIIETACLVLQSSEGLRFFKKLGGKKEPFLSSFLKLLWFFLYKEWVTLLLSSIQPLGEKVWSCATWLGSSIARAWYIPVEHLMPDNRPGICFRHIFFA